MNCLVHNKLNDRFVYDSSPRNLKGVLRGTVESVSGKSGNALYFNGSSGKVKLPELYTGKRNSFVIYLQ